MNFIIENYIIIIFIGLFIVFSLIGYLGETINKNKSFDKNKKEEINEIDQIEDINIISEKIKQVPKETNNEDINFNKVNINNTDDLLEDYNNSN